VIYVPYVYINLAHAQPRQSPALVQRLDSLGLNLAIWGHLERACLCHITRPRGFSRSFHDERRSKVTGKARYTKTCLTAALHSLLQERKVNLFPIEAHSYSPRSSSQSYHLLTQNRFENRTGITKTVLEKAEPPPRCSQTGRKDPQCSYKSAESSKKGLCFSPSHGHAATSQIHQHSTGARTGTPAPSRAAGPLPGESQHHA
jgi:hypothetical protein